MKRYIDNRYLTFFFLYKSFHFESRIFSYKYLPYKNRLVFHSFFCIFIVIFCVNRNLFFMFSTNVKDPGDCA